MTIRSIVVYGNLSPWDNWQPLIEAEMARLGIPLTDRYKIQFTILRPENARPKRKKNVGLSPFKKAKD